MIIATAGHVDHGKTSLVLALTGMHTDSLAEEQRRGMTIDLGFASTPVCANDAAAGMLGFVDVPGHERFVRNMLAGVASVDVALLVVAADDGPMPQTHEHLAILGLLGVAHTVVALTKIDRVTAERCLQVAQQIAGLLADARLFPLVANAGPTAAGVPALRQHLVDLARQRAAPCVAADFRLVVDRSFSVAGAGRIVTGAVLAGQLRVGDEVRVSPAGTSARVRSIEVHNRPADQVSAGQRCALNLAGVALKRAEPVRGDWVVAPALHAPTDRIDVMLTVLASAARPLSPRHTLQLHLGAAVVGVRVAALTAGAADQTDPTDCAGAGAALAPGSTGLAQLVLDRGLSALHGDRFILRDPAANHTLAGGWVVDPFGAVRGRSRPLRLRQLAALAQADPAQALAGLLATVSAQMPEGVDLQRFALARGLGDGTTGALVGSWVDRLALQRVAGPHGALVLTSQHWQTWRDQLLAAVARCHAEQPDSLGPDDAALCASLTVLRALRALAPGAAAQTVPQALAQAPPANPAVATAPAVPAQVRAVQRAALAALVDDGQLLREGLRHRRPEHQPVLADADRALLDRVASALRPAGLRPPIVGELASALDLPLPELLAFLARAARLGLLARVAPNRYYLPQTVSDLLALACTLAAESADGSLDAAAFRDRSGIGRNLTVQVLEFLHREGLTRFNGSRHWPLA